MVRWSAQVALILGLCLTLRMAFLLAAQPWQPERENELITHSDAPGYHALALTLLEEGRFSRSPQGAPETLRTPLYPLLIAAVYGAGGRPWLVLVVQAILATLTCALLYQSFARLFDRRLALLSAALFACDPILILYTSTLMSETLFVLALAIVVFFLSRAMADNASPRALGITCGLAGIALGCATLTRPIAQYLPLALAPFLAFHHRRRPQYALVSAGILCLAFLLTIAPWSLRNLRLFGTPSLSTSGAYNLLVLNVGTLEGMRLGADPLALQSSLLAKADSLAIADGEDPAALNPFDRARYRSTLARAYIRDDPVGFVRCYVRGMANSFMNLASWEFARVLGLELPMVQIRTGAGLREMLVDYVRTKGSRGLWIAALTGPFQALCYVGTAIGLVVAWRRGRRSSHFLTLLVSLYFVCLTGAAGLARFKVPSVPFYLPFAAAGLLFLYDRLVRRWRRQHAPNTR